jgi:hypothetical protein
VKRNEVEKLKGMDDYSHSIFEGERNNEFNILRVFL